MSSIPVCKFDGDGLRVAFRRDKIRSVARRLLADGRTLSITSGSLALIGMRHAPLRRVLAVYAASLHVHLMQLRQ